MCLHCKSCLLNMGNSHCKLGRLDIHMRLKYMFGLLDMDNWVRT
jgi:hypothetical protein